MIEAYTESAKKALLQGRYEASRFGSDSVEIEHVVLGLLRSDLSLAGHLLKPPQRIHEVCERLEREIPRKKTPFSSSGDLPLSQHCKGVLELAGSETERLGRKAIGTQHLLLGVLRENACIAARVLLENGLTVQQLEERVEPEVGDKSGLRRIGGLPDLVEEARQGKTAPLIGRQNELNQMIQILSRRTKNNPVLVGEAGVGKEALVRGLAQRIADADVPIGLMERPILRVAALEILSALAANPTVRSGAAQVQQTLKELIEQGTAILYVHGLFDFRDGLALLAGYVKHCGLQFIVTGDPLSFRLALDRHDELAQIFEPIGVLPPTPEETVGIISGSKAAFEQFHSVVISPDAIQTSVQAASRFFRNRTLPDSAMDLIDDASTRVKLRGEVQPPELVALKLKIRDLTARRLQAIETRAFALSEQLAGELNEERGRFLKVQKELLGRPQNLEIGAEDVLEAVASQTAISVGTIRAALQTPQLQSTEEIQRGLGNLIPVGRLDWLEGLADYLNYCSPEEAEELAAAIRRSKGKMGRAAQA